MLLVRCMFPNRTGDAAPDKIVLTLLMRSSLNTMATTTKKNLMSRVTALIAMTLAAIIFALVVSRPVPKPYSPETSAIPASKHRGRTAVWIDDTVHYNLRGGTADAEFAALAPPVDPSDPDATFSATAMVHQLQCLQVIRSEYTAGTLTEMGQHCMEYLRQSILCTADTRLESVRFFRPPHVVALPGEYECKDWTEVMRNAA